MKEEEEVKAGSILKRSPDPERVSETEAIRWKQEKQYKSAFKPILGGFRGPASKESNKSVASMKSTMRDRLNIANLPINYNRLSRQELLTAPPHYMSSISSRTTPLRNQRTSFFERVFNAERSSAETPEPFRYQQLIGQPSSFLHESPLAYNFLTAMPIPPPPLYGVDSNSPKVSQMVPRFGTPVRLGELSRDEKWSIP